METRKIVQGKKQMAAAAAAAAAVRTGKHVRSMGSSSYYMEEGGEGAQLSTYVLGTWYVRNLSEFSNSWGIRVNRINLTSILPCSLRGWPNSRGKCPSPAPRHLTVPWCLPASKRSRKVDRR